MEVIDIAVIINVLNVLLLSALLYTYGKNYFSVKAKFCLGLILFAGLFMIQNLIAIYFELFQSHCYSQDTAQFSLILNIIQTFGFTSLLYITWNP